MIYNKSDLKNYLYCDKIALGIEKKTPSLFGDEIWKFEILLRKLEYYTNCCNTMVGKIKKIIYKYKFHKASVKLNFSIPLNVFGPGLSIAHYGTIVVNGTAKIGKKCRLQEGVCIGATNGMTESPIIGDNCFIGTGAKLIGNITIGNDIAIGANSVVNKSFKEDKITIAGVPARKISNNSSYSNLSKLLLKYNLL